MTVQAFKSKRFTSLQVKDLNLLCGRKYDNSVLNLVVKKATIKL